MTTIGKSKRLLSGNTTDFSWFPGVGAYNIEALQPLKARGNSFTRAKRQITVDDGSYSSRKNKSDSFELKPGPGSYSLELRRHNKLLTFPHSKRFVTDNFRHPGPGAYKAQESSKQKIKAGIIARSKRSNTNIQQGPGPSDYLIPALIKYKKREPHILIGRAKRQSSEQENIPGPGAYNISTNALEKHRTTFYESKKSQQRGTMESIWHSRRIEKQAKIVKNQLTDYKS